MVTGGGILLCEISDHFATFLLDKELTREKDTCLSYRNYRSMTETSMGNAMQIVFARFTTNVNVNDSYNSFSNILSDVINDDVPIKKNSTQTKKNR